MDLPGLIAVSAASMSRARAHGLRAAVTVLAGATVGGIGLACEREPQASLATVPAAAQQRAWAETYGVVARLADAGSVDAARTALEMHHHGRRIYGMRFEASDQQLRRWQRQVSCTTPPCAALG